MSDANGKASARDRTSAKPLKPTDRAIELERELHETRTEIRALRAKAALRRLKESSALDYDWVGPWQSVLQQRQLDPNWLPIGSASARRHGTNFPFYQNEQQLTLLRDLSRIVVGTNNNAFGLLRGYNAFVFGGGFATKVAPRPDTGDAGTGASVRITNFLDRWAKRNNWLERQQELGRRTERDGDGILRLFPDDGWLKVRFVWPEQLTQPPGTRFEEWSFGLRCDEDDAETLIEACIANLNDPTEYDIVPADELVLFQPENDAGVKRRVPLFAFGMREVLDATGRLTRNLGEGAAVREAIAYMRQHAGAGPEDVEEFRTADMNFREQRPFADVYQPVNVWQPGTVVDFPEGMEHAGAPQNPGTAAHSAVVDLLVRSACARINAPEWLGSSNAANMGAYTSSLVAESPFVKGITQTQGYYKPRLLSIVERALDCAAAHGVIDAADLELVTVDLVPPSPEVRNKLEEAQRASIEIPLGVDSRPRYCESQDRDYEKISEENRQYAEENGPPGNPLPDQLPPGLPESLLENFTGVDSNGHHWVNGRQVKAGDREATGAAKAGSQGVWDLFKSLPADSDAANYLGMALHNSGVAEPERLAKLPAKVNHARLAGSLASAYSAAIRDGKSEAAEKMLPALTHFGLSPAHEAGASVRFDGSLYDGVAGMWTGHAARVVVPAILGPGGRVVYKGEVAQPAG